MTDRLAQLLSAEVGALEIPAPPTGDVLTRGHTMRRRRKTNRVIAGLAVVAIFAIGVSIAVGVGVDRNSAIDPAAPKTRDPGVAFSIGTTIYLDGGEVTAEIDDRAVKSLFYTSEGVLVRHGNNSFSDGGGPQRFSLVSPEGEVKRVSVETQETVHAADPDQPYLAYVQRIDGVNTLLVHDLVSDQEVARVPLPESVRGGFNPLAIDGDTVYVRKGNTVYVVDWRAGDVSIADVLKTEFVEGGHVDVGSNTPTPAVIDAASGQTLISADEGPRGSACSTSLPMGPWPNSPRTRTTRSRKGSSPSPNSRCTWWRPERC